MIPLVVMYTCFLDTVAWEIFSIRPAAYVETESGVSHISLRTTCQATLVDLESYLMSVTNGANVFSTS